MAHPGAIGDDRRGPVAESFPRESGASLYILVQVQAGPPRFALTGYAWRSALRDGGPSVKSLNLPVDGAFLGLSRVRNLV